MNREFVSLAAMFVVGWSSGVASVIFYALIKLRAIDKKAKELTDKIKAALGDETKTTTVKLSKSVKDRLNKAFDITERQLGILGALDQPQSGPLHGKYKNNLNSELKALEEEKIGILKSILDDGYNPKLTILNASSGEKETVSLTDFMKRYDQPNDLPPPPPPAKPRLRVVQPSDSVKEPT